MFDVPLKKRVELSWMGELPIENGEWNVGLIVGPSGCGKSTIAKEVFPDNIDVGLEWQNDSVVDDIRSDISIETITGVFGSVGFNTIPAWFRSYEVLSTGEKFRIDIARRIMELEDPIVVDEFTSVVDRQVAKIGAYAVQKYIRKNNRKFVAISCHYDVIDWLVPDWTFEPATMTYEPRRYLQQSRPKLSAEIKRVGYDEWQIFAPFHYLTASLHRAAKCFGLFINKRIVGFAGIMHRPNFKEFGRDIMGISRIVSLPDWQGLGIAPILAMQLGAAYKALGLRLRAYPAHPALIRIADKSPDWKLIKKPGYVQKVNRNNFTKRKVKNMRSVSRPGAVFEYCGEAMDKEIARKLIDGNSDIK
jgi:Fe-S cluster assembly ATPase SufC